jgi:magnesium transporter
MNRENLLSAIRAALQGRDATALQTLLRRNPVADIVERLSEIGVGDSLTVLRLLPVHERAWLFCHFEADMQDAMLDALRRDERVGLFEHLPSDDRADIYNRMDEERREQLMPALAKVERDDILQLASFPEGTVGSITTSDYATVPRDATAAEALAVLRRGAPDKETIYQIFVVDDDRRLIGAFSLRDLVLAAPQSRVADIMTTEVISAQVDRPREDAALLISRYDLLALPVVDEHSRLVGIVTVDDAMDVAEEESTEDFHKGGGTLALKDLSVREASTWLLYRKRVYWLVLLVFGNLFSGAGIAYFEETIAAYLALLFFLPLLVASGGNAGSQAATLMVRALATGDVVMKDWLKMLGREFLVAGLLGLTMALAVSGIGWMRGGPDIAVVVTLSMVIIVMVGSVFGMSLPFLLSRLKLDPASASAPLITSIADVIGVMLYFSIAVYVLGAPAVGG